VAVIESPVGPLRAVFDGGGLRSLVFDSGGAVDQASVAAGADARADLLREELGAYFAVGGVGRAGGGWGFRTPLDPIGTEFQRAVWRELATIPAGETRTYGRVAAAIGRPGAVRAVARANAANPIAILVPCHRVIGADGTLTGYAGGLERKAWLLDHEGRATGLLLVRGTCTPGEGVGR
jgi:methylated-DNA-[protein]-cysteine S-methyltransferase